MIDADIAVHTQSVFWAIACATKDTMVTERAAQVSEEIVTQGFLEYFYSGASIAVLKFYQTTRFSFYRECVSPKSVQECGRMCPVRIRL